VPLKRRPAEEREQRKQERAVEREARRFKKQAEAFYATPQGQARLAFDRGDHVFQYEVGVMNQQAVIVAMVGSTSTHKAVDPTWVLNSVCREGWELVNGSFVFVEQGQQSRDKFMASGQNVAVRGKTVGYYLFKRCPANRHADEPPAASTPASLDDAITLFEEGEILAAAEVMRQLSDEAHDADDQDAIGELENASRQMRDHLARQERAEFDRVWRS
jgi:hypothetical protein